MREKRPLVSVVVPTFNAGLGFERLLAGISEQRGNFDVEVIVVDSGSTDGTVERARRHGATVHSIPKEEFNHGGSRNLGVSLARGEYVALTVQDAVPLDGNWLAAMVRSFEEEERVAGVYGRQVPRAESGILSRVVVNSIATAGSVRREQYAGSPELYRALTPAQRRDLAAFDNVSSGVRRSVWEEIPFEPTNFGEDIRWGRAVVEAGYKVVYEPESAVIHSHDRNFVYDLRRNYINQVVVAELFGLVQVPNIARLLVAILASSLHVFSLLRKEGGGKTAPRDGARFALIALRHAVVSQAGVYLGSKVGPADGRLARSFPRLRRRLDGFLSRGV